MLIPAGYFLGAARFLVAPAAFVLAVDCFFGAVATLVPALGAVRARALPAGTFLAFALPFALGAAPAWSPAT
ncbi:MAG: hypothetical protein ACK5HY_14135, partial [Parahaliea sp.]